jgi:hypothetical protein
MSSTAVNMSTSSPSTDAVLLPLAERYGIPVEELQELTKRAVAAKNDAYCAFHFWLMMEF